MLNIWSRLCNSRTRSFSRRKPLRTRGWLGLESLEGRVTPAATTVSLDPSGSLRIDDTEGGNSNDNITIQSDAANGQFVISDPNNAIGTSIAGATGDGTNTVTVPFSSVAGGAILVNTFAGDDLLTVDFSLGNVAKTINYDGGLNGSGGDELQLLGSGVFANVTHAFTSASAGSVAVTGNALISYSGLEPVTDNLSAADRVFTFTGGSESILVDDVLGGPAMVVDSTLGEFVIFNPPTNSLTIDAGTGNDIVNVGGVDSTFAASLIIDGGTGNDTATIRLVNSSFGGSLTIHGGEGNDSVDLFSDITFAANRHLDLNLQDDVALPASAGMDRINVAANANLVLSGAGTATVKASNSISLTAGASIITADGALILEANKARVADTSFSGITVQGATVQSTGSGAVQILGRGGVQGTGDAGVRVFNSVNGNIPGVIQSGTGPLQVLGTGGINNSGSHPGVAVAGAGSFIGSAGGNVQVTGEGGGAGSSFSNVGVIVDVGGRISAGGTGTVTVLGTGGTSGGPNSGVRVTAGGVITSSNGNVQVTGVGVALGATNGNNHGVHVANSGQISAGGTGTVMVHGTASSAGGVQNHGVFVTGSGALIASSGGNIQVTGVQGASGSSTVDHAFGINLNANGSIAAGNAANIELISDSMRIDTTANVNGGLNAVTLRQRTNGTAINLGAADSAGVMGLTDAELDRVTGSVINIGDLNSGTITLSATVSRGPTTNLNLTSGSDIAFLSGFLIDVITGTLTLSAPNGSITTPPGTSVTAPDLRAPTTNVDGVVAPGGAAAGDFAVVTNLVLSSTDRYRAQITGAGPATQYDVITVSSGTATLGNATLEVLPTLTPSIGQQFTIVNTTGGVSGTFRDTNGNTLNEDSTFIVNGINFSITYQGGADSRDVVLTALTTGFTIFVSDAAVVETNAGSTTITFNVTLSAQGNQTIAANWATANGTATTADSDYLGASGTVTFGPGDTSEQVTITVNGDPKFEPDETFVVNLSNAVGATIGDNQGVGTIVNDDNGPTSSIDDVTGIEGTFTSSSFTFTVSLTNPTFETVDINYQVFDGTATAADYFGSSSGTLTFSPGETTQTITVDINADDRFELDESFTVRIFTGTSSPATDDTGVGTILDDDNEPTITIHDLTGLEFNSGTRNLTFPVILSNPSYLPITVNFATADDSATVVDNDYQPLSGILTFNPGQTVMTVTVLINGDTKFEPTENFTLNLSNATNATIADPTAVGGIQNDDSQPAISINDLSMPEGNSGIVEHLLTVSLSNASTETVSVSFSTANGTASSGDNDYEPSSGTVTFAPGETSKTARVLILGDTKFEADETFTMNLSSPVNATIADDSGLGTILNDDSQPRLTLSIAKDWSFQTVDSAGDVGAWSSLKIGSDNRPRIAYEDRSTSSRNLKYASFDGVAWNIQTAHDDPTDTVGQYASLTLDSLNRPHIAYQNFSDSVLLYAHYDGTSWVRETANASSYLHIALDLDSQNRPLISSFNHNTNDLNLARRVGGTWSVETPDSVTAPTGFYTSLAVDSADRPWIAYVNGFSGPGQTLRLARHDGTAWQFQTIASGTDFRDNSLVFDALGRPHVSYYDSGALKYAFFDGAAWTITTVDANNAGEHNSLALDSLNRPRIAYIGSGAARFASFDGNAWTTQFVGAQANYTSLALDQNDLATISYYSTTSADLVLATQVTASMSENGGSKMATVSRTDTAGALTVDLLSNDTTEATVVATIVFADGQATSAPFNINAVDDSIVDGTQTVTITASAAGYIGDTDTVNVTDDDPMVTLSLVDSPLAENGGATTVTATLSAVSDQDVTVNLGFTGTATHPTDYAPSGTSIVIAAGSTTGSVTLTGLDDPTDEADETIVVDIIGVTNGTEAGTQRVTATITDDDLPPSLSINDVTITEGNSGSIIATFTVSLSQASSRSVSVNVDTADNSAVAPGDYTAVPATLISFAPGQTTRTFTVRAQGDLLDESNETYNVNLSGAVNATILDGEGVGTITDDDAPPSLSINDVSLLEGDNGTTAFVFTVSLSNASGQPVSVNFATADGSALVSDNDYQSATGTVTFSPGQTSQTITVLVTGDSKFEPTETFTVDLSGPVNATIADPAGLGTIENDDHQPTISINDVSLAEGNAGTTGFVFTVSLSNPSSQAITVDFATAVGSATLADNDYQSAGGTVTFSPGQTSRTVTVLANGDTKFEVDETFTVALAGAANATIADFSGLGTIRNDDAQPTISVNNVTLSEGNSGTKSFAFTVSLSNASAQTITVNFATSNGTATSGDNDYQVAGGMVTFAAGQTSQTVTVLVNGDTKFEPDETFLVNLSGATNATIADGQGQGTIVNDDAEGGTVELIGGVLTIRGTAGADTVSVDRSTGKNAQILVQASFLAAGSVSFNESSVTKIVIILREGNDVATIAAKVGVDVSIRGGKGNDVLQGGPKNDILIGGEGDDVVTGGSGRDLLIGGAGADRLDGGQDEDILIAGITDHDANDAALLAIMMEWTSGHSLLERVNNLKDGSGGGSGGPRNGTTFLSTVTVHDDGALDQLTGGGSSDWFLYNFSGSGVQDVATDLGGAETDLRLDL